MSIFFFVLGYDDDCHKTAAAAAALALKEDDDECAGGATMAQQPPKTRSSSMITSPKQVIPIDPSQLVIEKQGGKKTASIFCLRRNTPPSIPPLPVKAEEEGEELSINNDTLCTSSSGCFSDTMSVVSDISDLSVMTSYYHKPVPVTHRVGSTSLPPRHRCFLPGVHGQQAVASTKFELTNAKKIENLHLELMRETANAYRKKTDEISSHKQTSSELKEKTFLLERENVNLRSSLKTLQDLCDSMRSSSSSVVSSTPISNGKTVTPIHDSSSKDKLSSAQDRIWQLEAELERAKIQEKDSQERLHKLELNNTAMAKVSVEYNSRNCALESRSKELEMEIANALTGKMSAEHSLNVVRSERDSLIKSRDWYGEEMKKSQETRAQAQRDLMILQKENLSKENAIEVLKNSLTDSRREIDEERENFLKEKTEMKRRLEDLEVELTRPPTSSHNNDELAGKIKTLEEDNAYLTNESREFRQFIKKLEKNLADEKEKVDRLTHEKNQLAQLHQSTFKSLEVIRIKFEETEAKMKECELLVDVTKRELLAKTEILDLMKSSAIESEIVISGLKGEKTQLEQNIAQVKDDLSHTTNTLNKLKTEVNRKDTFIEELTSERNLLKAENLQFQNDCSQVNETLNENLNLKKKLLNLEALQKQNLDLMQENETLTLNTNILEAKRAEYEALIERNRENMNQASEEIDGKNERISDLEEKVGTLENSLAAAKEEESPVEDRVLGLYLNEIDSLKDKLAEKEANESDLRRRINSIVDDETDYAKEIIGLRKELEKVTRENRDIKSRMEQDVIADDEYKGLQSIKIARLENHISEYESDINTLTQKVKEMEQDILELEKVNGNLVTENQQVQNLKSQIDKIKTEYSGADDTLRGLINQKAQLIKEVNRQEELLLTNKSQLSKVNNALALEKSTSGSLRTEIKSLKTGLDTANLTIDNLKSQMGNMRNEMERKIQHYQNKVTITSVSSTSSVSELTDLKSQLEKAQLCQGSLEDQLKNLNFNLHQKNSELENLRVFCQTQTESHSKKSSSLEETVDRYKTELNQERKLVQKVSEEKRKYQSQVQEMNVALRTCLVHLKDLRTRTTGGSVPTSTCSSPIPYYEDSTIQELLDRCSKPSGIGRNLQHLQTCLSTLKTEMASLQEKLDANSNPSSRRSSPEKKN